MWGWRVESGNFGGTSSMNDNALQITIRNAFYRCTRLMHSKGKEYSPGEDRLSNFKDAGAMQRVSPEQALFGMLTKHLVSLADMCKAVTAGGEPATQEMWIEKLTDSTNYLFLLTALLKERYGWGDEQ
jgi:hypothetical protein